MSTPVTQDLMSRFMAEAYDEHDVIGVSTGFQTFFARPEVGGRTVFRPDANQVDIDIVRGDERMAALIPRGTVSRVLSGQKNLRDGQYSTFSRKFPLSEEEGDITSDKLLSRRPGETPYDTQTRFDRMRAHGLNLYHEAIRRHVRLFEYLAAQSILTGKMPAIVGTTNTDLIYDFLRASTHTVTAGTAWSNPASLILADIDTGCAAIRAHGKLIPDGMVVGATAMNSMLNNTQLKAVADNRRFELIMFGNGTGVGDDMFIKGPYAAKFAKFVRAGFIPRGVLRTPAGFELIILSYLDYYTADNGTPTRYMPDDKVVIFASQARCDRYFGPPEQLPMIPMREQLYRELFGFDPSAAATVPNIKGDPGVIDPRSFYTDAYVSQDWKRVTIRVQSAPIFATTQTDGFYVIDTEP